MEKSIGGDKTIDTGGNREGGAYTLAPGDTLGQYRIVRPLGRGGMGEVYEAENVVNRKRLALKVLPPAAVGGTFVDRFRIESRVMMDLRHDHIVQVHHAGEDRGLYYLTMDLVAGAGGEPFTLEDRLAQGRLPPHEAKTLALQMCDAVAYAHGQEIIHRDLKPSNVLLDRHGRAQVADFGLAKVVGADYLQTVIQRSISLSITEVSLSADATLGRDASPRRPSSSARALLGTYDYMAPEQKAGAEITPRADVFALGVILYRMLTGKKPEGRFKLPSKLGCPKTWDAIVEKCLQPDPAARYATAAELHSAILKVGRGRRSRRFVSIAAVLSIALGAAWWFLKPASPPPVAPAPAPAPVAPPTVPGVQKVAIRFEVKPPGVKLSVFGEEQILAASGITDTQGVFTANLEPGRYEIEAQKDGYQLLAQALEVTKADTQALELTPLRGGLTVQTTPGALVKARGTAGTFALGAADDQGLLRYDRLVEGTYTLEITHPDYSDGAASVEIRKDRPAQARTLLKGRPGAIYISASPEAEVWVDGQRKGATGERLDGIEPGTRRIEVRKAGYQTQRFALDVPPNHDAPRKVLGDLVHQSGSLRMEADVQPAEAREHFQGLDKKVVIGSNAWTAKDLPLVRDGLECVEHTVTLEAAGYDIAPQTATVSDGETNAVQFIARARDSRIPLRIEPSSAGVYDPAGKALQPDAQGCYALPSFTSLKDYRVQAEGYEDAALDFLLDRPGTTFKERTIALRKLTEPKPGTERVFEIASGVKMTFCWVPATTSAAWKRMSGGKDTFSMGSPGSEADRDNNETPHEVRLTKGFWLGKYEVTQAEWQAVMGSNPSNFKGARNPVEQVSWSDIQTFLGKLNDRTYRLPTEAEWEYACRAGTTGAYAGDLDRMGWYGTNSGSTTHPVGQKAANAWGLYDMHGNVWEWCADGYGEYPAGLAVDPSGPSSGEDRVYRGGSWGSDAGFCRSAIRFRYDPGWHNVLGFRLARDNPPTQDKPRSAP